MRKDIDFQGRPVAVEIEHIKNKNPYFHMYVLTLLFVIEGEAEVNRMDDIFHLKPGDFITIDSGRMYSVKSEKGTVIASFYIELQHFLGDRPHIHGNSYDATLIADSGEEPEFRTELLALRNYFIRIVIQLTRDMTYTDEIIEELSTSVLDMMTMYFLNRRYMKKPLIELKDDVRQRILDYSTYLEKYALDKDITIQDLAGMMNISVTRMNHFLQETIDMSMQGGIRLRRVGEVERLISSTELSMDEIADICGYSDTKYLYKHFKDTFGITPADYKKRHQDKHGQQEIIERYDWREYAELITGYIKTFYHSIKHVGYIHGDENKRQREENLLCLYDYLIFIDDRLNDKFISMTKNIALIDDRNIHWEYTYEAIMKCLDTQGSIVIIARLTDIEKWDWLLILTRLWHELELIIENSKKPDREGGEILGRKVKENDFKIIIAYHFREQNREAKQLAEDLIKHGVKCEVETLFLF